MARFDDDISDLEVLQTRAAAQRAPVTGESTPIGTHRTKWDDDIGALTTDAALRSDPNVMEDLKTFAKFSGHGIARGLAETAGLPMDIFNAGNEFLNAHPEAMLDPEGMGVSLPENAVEKAAAMPRPIPGSSSIRTGSTPYFRGLLDAIGATTSTPEEAGMQGSAPARVGDTLGEFTGSALPFIAGAPARVATAAGTKLLPNAARILMADSPFKALMHDLLGAAWGPGIGAATGEEATGYYAGDDSRGAGKLVGGLAGALRLQPLEAAAQLGKRGYSWLQDFLLSPKAGEARAGRVLAGAAINPAEANAAIESPPAMSPGAKIMTGNLSGDDGLLALQREVISRDAQMSGQYKQAISATEDAIKRDAQLSPANYPDTASWLDAKQKRLETLTNQRLMQAEQQAEQDTATAVRGVETDRVDATQAKAAFSTNLKSQLLLAQDDLKAVTDAKWAQVDKTRPVDTSPLYDEVNTMMAEHAARPAESDDRFPFEFTNKLFAKPQESSIVDASGKPMATTSGQRFGPVTPLQNVVDLNSEVQQAARVESAKDAPDRVYLAYLTRLSKALQNTMGTAAGGAGDAALQDAMAATRFYHDTFSKGPVGQVLGHDVPGAPDVTPAQTIKHFLAQGPAGVDAMTSLFRAIEARSGTAGALPAVTSDAMRQTIRNYIRQDFYDHVMANGQFNQRAAQQWMSNNAGAIGAPTFSDLRKEFQNAISSQGNLSTTMKATQRDLEDIQNNRAALFLQGKPGQLLNGAVDAKDQYGAAKDLVGMVRDDPTGRAFAGLKQMVFDKLVADSIEVSHGTAELERINGAKMGQWFDSNQGVFKALEEVDPGTTARAQRIVNTAKMLERYYVNPSIPQGESLGKLNALGQIMLRLLGAGIGSRMPGMVRGGSIQSAAIGSQYAQQLFSSLSTDMAMKAARRAFVDPDFFKAITKPFDPAQPEQTLRLIQPYFYSMGIPLAQPALQQDQKQQGQGR